MTKKDMVLDNRAKILASKIQTDGIHGDALDIVIFKLAHETYGIELEYIREVYPLKDLTPVPCTPFFIGGIINYRGQIISTVDLRKFFDLPIEGINDLNRVIILESESMMFGILADAICETGRVPMDMVQCSIHTLDEVRRRYLRGITSDNIIILDGQKLLSDPRMVIGETRY